MEDITGSYRKPLIIIAASVAILIVLGFIAIGDFTLSSLVCQTIYGNKWLYIIYQFAALAVGAILGCIMFRLKDKLLRYALPLAAVGLLLGLAALLPDSRIFPNYLRHRYALIFGVEWRAAFWLLVFCLPLLASLLSRLEDGQTDKHLKVKTVALILVIGTLILSIPDAPIFFLFSVTLVAALFLGEKPLRKIKTAAFALTPFWVLIFYRIYSRDYLRAKVRLFYDYSNDTMGPGRTYSRRMVRSRGSNVGKGAGNHHPELL
jgi:cell division protein FtsW (lipid II flippase)